jgi:hypothetical protein
MCWLAKVAELDGSSLREDDQSRSCQGNLKSGEQRETQFNDLTHSTQVEQFDFMRVSLA